MSLLLAQVHELEAQAAVHLPIHPVSKEILNPVIPSFKVETSSQSPTPFLKPRIPSFKAHSSANPISSTNPIQHPLEEPLSGHRQPSHLISSPVQSCQESVSNQDIQRTGQFSWTSYPGYEMPNLVKDTLCEPIQNQEIENRVTSAHSELQKGEITKEAQLGQQVSEQHDEDASLAIGKDTGEETVMCFFDELPLFMEQEENVAVQTISVQTLQQQDINDEVTLDKGSTRDMEDDEVLGEECFDSIIRDFCENLGAEITSCEPIEEGHVLEHTLLVENILKVDSLDKLLNYLTEDGGPLTQGEEMKWQEIMQGSHDEPQQGANMMSAKFIISRGCPIRHLARMEAKN